MTNSTRSLLLSCLCVFALTRAVTCFGDAAPATPAPQATPEALRNAATGGDVAMIQSLLDQGVPVDAVSEGFSPLMMAAFMGNVPVARFLVKRGADIQAARDGMETNMNQIAPAEADFEARGKDSAAANIRATILSYKKGIALLDRLAAEKNSTAAAAQGLSQEQVAQIAAQAAEAAVKKSQPNQPQAPQKEIKSDVDKPAYHARENPKDFAVVIGVEKYFNDLPEAQFAERDAQAVKDHLIALGYPERNIKFLTGQRATKSGIESNLETWLARNVGKDSTVFVYYSGHGAPDPVSGEAYLVPADGDPDLLQDTAYPTKRLYAKLNALKAKRVIVALDSCFSGAGGRSVLAKGARPLVNKVDLGLGSGKVVALSASAGNQISGTMEEQGHGAFTYYFLKGLNGAAADASGHVTMRGLYDYLVPQVQNAASRHNRDQTPQLSPGVSGSGSETIQLR